MTQPSDSSPSTPTPAAVGLLVAAYTQEGAADDTVTALGNAASGTGFVYDDAAVVRRNSQGRVHISETGDMSTGAGAGIGALVGGVIGILGGPAGIAIGAGAGAALGGLAAHADTGFDQESLERLGAALPAGTSALVVTTSQGFVEAVRDQASDGENLTMATQIAGVVHEHLAAREDVLLAMVLTEDGVTASKVVSSPEQLAVFNISASDDAAAAEAAVVTEDGAAGVAGIAVAADDAPAAAGVVESDPESDASSH